MKIAFIGAGALGSYVGSVLAEAGVDLTLYDVRKDHVEMIRKEGLTISPAGGESKHYKAPITDDLSGMGKMDAVIVATKSYHTKAAIEGAVSLVGDDTLVCSFQNGAGNLDVLNEVVGIPERIVAMTTAHSFMMVSPTHLQYFLGAGGVELGPMQGEVSPKIQELAEIMKNLKVPVMVHDRGSDVVWNKILWNAVLNCTAAVTGMDVPAMCETPEIHPVFNAIGDEYFGVSEKMDVKVTHPRNFVELLIFAGRAAGKIKGVKPVKPSMLQDLEAGRLTEVEFINGAIVRQGEKHGVPTPVNKTMVHIVKTIEKKGQPDTSE